LQEALRDPREAAEYLNACLEDGSRNVFLLALRQVAEAHGVARIAKAAKRGRETLHRTLSSGGNPTLETLLRLFDANGLKLAVEPKSEAEKLPDYRISSFASSISPNL
jgi:probable addiction module antidote protein